MARTPAPWGLRFSEGTRSSRGDAHLSVGIFQGRAGKSGSEHGKRDAGDGKRDSGDRCQVPGVRS
jgi:hypothetical protein